MRRESIPVGPSRREKISGGAGDSGRCSPFVVILAVFLCFGCATSDSEHEQEAGVVSTEQRLAVDLASLADDSDESTQLAQVAIAYSHALADEYRIARPPLFHNVLVNVGIKERGLCWHWTEDLLAHLRTLRLEHYDLYWGTAYPGKLFREHNSVIVTAKGSPFASGLVLDPWRHSGELYWVPVGEDSYPWELH